MTAGLAFAARHGRVLLILGLVAGIGLPGLAQTLRPWLPALIVALLYVSALRIGPAALGAVGVRGRTLALTLAYQVALPLALAAAFAGSGLGLTPLAAAVLLVTAAPPITGAPTLAILAGHDPAPAMRLLIAGTALLPLTALPVFALTGAGEAAQSLVLPSLRLTAVILAATAAAWATRRWLLPAPATAPLDGASAILMACVVVGLMSAVGPALAEAPERLAIWLAAAFAVNLGLQLGAALLFRTSLDRVPLAISAGNRNIALFLVALPPERTDALLLFIGCYQIPMYLTPLLWAAVKRLS
ncbi:MAG: hypothetical protein AAFU80_03550 [Pseudomonadota bacterium]